MVDTTWPFLSMILRLVDDRDANVQSNCLCKTSGLSMPVEQISIPVSLLLAWLHSVLRVFPGLHLRPP